MKQADLLEQLYQGEVTVDEAYDHLMPAFDRRNLKRARFVKLRMILPNESKRLNLFLRLLFSLPIPIFFARFGLKFAGSQNSKKSFIPDLEGFTPEDLYGMLKYAKGTTVTIQAEDATILIKIR